MLVLLITVPLMVLAVAIATVPVMMAALSEFRMRKPASVPPQIRSVRERDNPRKLAA